jgi:hypothetical protein
MPPEMPLLQSNHSSKREGYLESRAPGNCVNPEEIAEAAQAWKENDHQKV